jgi:serine/threonine protein kinase
MAAVNVTVDGKPVPHGETHVLSTSPSRISINGLDFEFRYTDFTYTSKFYRERDSFVKKAYPLEMSDTRHHTPTPAPDISHKVGDWVLSKYLGSGVSGSVRSATHTNSQVAAVKIFAARTKSLMSLEEIYTNLSKITEQAKQQKCQRILLLQEVSPPMPSPNNDTYLVMSPMVAHTLHRSKDLKLARGLFMDILEGLNFLHQHLWVHGDIKPANIGVSNGRAVILDLDDAIQLRLSETLPATPGRGGAIGYLAPEREMTRWNHSVDVWAAAVVGYQLIYGEHPRRFAENPWSLVYIEIASERCKHVTKTLANYYVRLFARI